ncbi:MAG: RsmE family RNA methyltransferase [Ilumatobacteraceae bacterium]
MNPALRRSAAHVFVESIESPLLDEQDQHHLARVLRLRVGETVSVSDGCGAWRLCTFLEGAELAAETEVIVEPARVRPVTVGFALPKADRPEWIVQKLTEIGVDHLVVLEADRSITRWAGDKAERNLVKLRKVAREASMQSRRVRLPRIDGLVGLADLSGVVATPVTLAEPGGRPLDDDDRCLLIGPEGGWSPAELARVDDHAALGEPILRVETAALVAAARLVTFADRRSG